MDNFIIFNMIFFVIVAYVLMAFAVFAIGFLMGYKSEDRKILKRKQQIQDNKIQESDKEKRAKKEWKKFLEYDGSTPTGVE